MQTYSIAEALCAFLANDEFKDIDIDTTLFDQDRSKQQGRKIQNKDNKHTTQSLRGMLQHKGKRIPTKQLCKPVEYNLSR